MSLLALLTLSFSMLFQKPPFYHFLGRYEINTDPEGETDAGLVFLVVFGGILFYYVFLSLHKLGPWPRPCPGLGQGRPRTRPIDQSLGLSLGLGLGLGQSVCLGA